LAEAEKCKTGRPIVARRAAGKGAQTAAHTATHTKKHMKMHDMASQHPAPAGGATVNGNNDATLLHQWRHLSALIACKMASDVNPRPFSFTGNFIGRKSIQGFDSVSPHRPRSRFISWKHSVHPSTLKYANITTSFSKIELMELTKLTLFAARVQSLRTRNVFGRHSNGIQKKSRTNRMKAPSLADVCTIDAMTQCRFYIQRHLLLTFKFIF
jgi:hypothetical protein